MRIVGPIIQKKIHQEIAGDGHALRGDRQASRSPRRARPSPAIS